MELFDHSLIIGAVLGAAPVLIIATVAWCGRRNKYKQLPSAHGFQLRYCSSSRFQRFWKFFPWEGIGHLEVDQQDLVFHAQPNKGPQFTLRVPIENLQLHGRRNWFKNSFLPWLLLKNEPNDYYLCVETGPLIFGAGRKSRNILASITQEADQARCGQQATRPESI